jgi:twitching motility protein PilT
MDINRLLMELIRRRGSDLHLKVGRPPLFRISSELLPSEFPALKPEDMRAILTVIMDKRSAERFRRDLEADFSYALPGKARFRVNVFLQRMQVGIVIRLIPLQIPTLDQLGLPPVLKDLVQKPQGVILVTGPTGSGKSTTLSAMVNHINMTRNVHIITLEDPVEFVYTDQKATINQRQLGTDTLALNEALKRALRQDPDVILIGELRDRETMETAIHAAETGHLVFSTLHTNDAKQSVDRLLDSFPGDVQKQVRKMLALNLVAVLSQRLVKRADGRGRIAAMEVMVNSPHVAQLLEEGDTLGLEKAISKSDSYYRMQTFNQALADHVKRGLISQQDAMATSFNPDDLNLLLRGIVRGAADSRMIRPDAAATGAQPPPAPAPKPAPAVPAPAPNDPPRPKIMRGFKFT